VQAHRSKPKTSSRQAPASTPAKPSEQFDAPVLNTQVYQTTLDQLTKAERLDTPLGQSALVIASRIDYSSRESGSGLTSLTRGLMEILDLALAGSAVEDDPVDELKAKRDEKLRRAGRAALRDGS